MLGWVRVTYLLFTRCCQAGALELDCHSQLKPRPVSGAGEAAAGAGVFIWVSCYKSALSRHMSRGAAVAHSQFTQTHCSVYGVICSGDLTASSGHCSGARIVSEGGHYCHYGQLNHLTWCRATYWWCAAPGLFLAPSSAQRNVFFSAVLLECPTPPLIPGLNVSQLFPTMHSSISAANRQAAANINKLRIKVRIISLSSNLRSWRRSL